MNVDLNQASVSKRKDPSGHVKAAVGEQGWREGLTRIRSACGTFPSINTHLITASGGSSLARRGRDPDSPKAPFSYVRRTEAGEAGHNDFHWNERRDESRRTKLQKTPTHSKRRQIGISTREVMESGWEHTSHGAFSPACL